MQLFLIGSKLQTIAKISIKFIEKPCPTRLDPQDHVAITLMFALL